MFIYEYETVYCRFRGWGIFSGSIYKTLEHREIITAKAGEGWRLVGFVPVKQRKTGHIQILDLIFEKEVKKQN